MHKVNFLTDSLPNCVFINGKSYFINTDFRIWIKITQFFTNLENNIEQVGNIFFELFKSMPNEPVEDIVKAIMEFYSPANKRASKDKNAAGERRYDFDYDDGMIYAAFMQQYNIDLSTATLHWWHFKELLNNLGEDTQFVKVIGYRAINLSEIKDKEQRKWYAKMKRVYKLPDNRTQEEKEQSVVNAFLDCF